MLAWLRNKIADYVTEHSNMENWKNIRENYFYSSYLAFLTLAVCEINGYKKKINIINEAIKYRIEEPEVLDWFLKRPNAELFTEEILRGIPADGYETNLLYQEYLSADFTASDGKFVFGNGKDSRDVLGSYYTQEEFACEIVRKAIGDYRNGTNTPKKMTMIDLSCGGGAFLAAAVRCLNDRDVSECIFGYDVDPVAVVITRARIVKESGYRPCEATIKLGNPLIRSSAGGTVEERLEMAASGRFYHVFMASPIENTYDIVVGNPPWEKLRFEEKKFFSHYASEQSGRTKEEREALLDHSSMINRQFYYEISEDYRKVKKIIKSDSFFQETSCGELNTYALFTELSLKLLDRDGITGLIIKSSLVKMPVYKSFFQSLTENKKIYELYMFQNRKKIFNIDSREQFSVIFMSQNCRGHMKAALDLEEYRNFQNQEKIEFSYKMMNLINPDTGMMPNVRNDRELRFLIELYKKNPLFSKVYEKCRFGRLVHLTNHSEYIVRNCRDGYLPIYEGKFIEIYTAKYATYEGLSEEDRYKNKASARLIKNPEGTEFPLSRFFIKEDVWKNLSKNFKGEYVLAWRSLTSATNRRTMLATLLPLVPSCQSIQLLQLEDRQKMLHVLSVFNSIVFDYIVRLKMAGLDLTQTMIKQIPVPPEEKYQDKLEFKGKIASVEVHLNSRIAGLYRNDVRMDRMFAGIVRYDLPEIYGRKELIAQMDTLAAYLYGVDPEQLKEIAASFEKYYTEEERERWF